MQYRGNQQFNIWQCKATSYLLNRLINERREDGDALVEEGLMSSLSSLGLGISDAAAVAEADPHILPIIRGEVREVSLEERWSSALANRGEVEAAMFLSKFLQDIYGKHQASLLSRLIKFNKPLHC